MDLHNFRGVNSEPDTEKSFIEAVRKSQRLFFLSVFALNCFRY